MSNLGAKGTHYDYTVHDRKGIIGVKDGVEYPISKEDWERENPRVDHKDTNCTECSFVSDADTLFMFNITREQKERASHNPEFVGKFTMPGWTGHSGFHLFKCQECGTVCVDYPHGYTDNGLLYLRCKDCRTNLVLRPKEERAIYVNEGVHIPKEDPKDRKKELQKIIEGASERGVRVIINGKDFTGGARVNVWTVGLVCLGIWTMLIALGVI